MRRMAEKAKTKSKTAKAQTKGPGGAVHPRKDAGLGAEPDQVDFGVAGIIETRPSPLESEELEAPEVLEFAQALDRYKRTHGRPFPSCGEILHVLREIGWERKGSHGGEGRR